MANQSNEIKTGIISNIEPCQLFNFNLVKDTKNGINNPGTKIEPIMYHNFTTEGKE